MRYRFVVSVDTATGEVVAAAITEGQANNLIIAPSAARTVENYGAFKYVEAAKDALGSIIPEPADV